VQVAPGPQSVLLAQGRKQVPALQLQPAGQLLSTLQCWAGVLTLPTGPILVPSGWAEGGLLDMLLGEQKLPAGLMVQVSVEPQSPSEWHPGQQPMVVQMVPAPHWALVVQAG